MCFFKQKYTFYCTEFFRNPIYDWNAYWKHCIYISITDSYCECYTITLYVRRSAVQMQILCSIGLICSSAAGFMMLVVYIFMDLKVKYLKQKPLFIIIDSLCCWLLDNKIAILCLWKMWEKMCGVYFTLNNKILCRKSIDEKWKKNEKCTLWLIEKSCFHVNLHQFTKQSINLC